MIKHNLTLALRHFWTKRVYSFIILLSLTVGFVCSCTLIAFLAYETNTDKFHSKHERIFQVFSDDPFADNGKLSYILKGFVDYVSANYPEIENFCQVGAVGGASIEVKKTLFHDFKVLSVDTAFFTLFDFPLLHGNRATCLAPGQIVLSAEKAMTVFGQTDVLNELLTVHTPDTTVQLLVSGVVDTPSENSHLLFHALVHPSLLAEKWRGGVTYLLLGNNDALQQFEVKINSDGRRPSLTGPGKGEYFFNPLANAYFNGENKMGFMKTRSPVFIKVVYAVCGLILFIASFNFINLFLLFGQSRRKEVGIRKMLGVTRTGLFVFSLAEAGMYIVFSFFISMAAVGLLLPLFNTVFDTKLSAGYFLRLHVVAPLAGIVLLFSAVVVSIAVFKQWRMKPVSLMAKDPSKVRFSRVLFTFQFIISITLAICSVTIIEQIDHIRNAPLGFNRNIIQLNAPGFQFSESLQVLKQRVAMLPDVNDVTISGGNPISGNAVVRLELEDDKFYSAYLFGGDEDFPGTLDLELVEGVFPSVKRKGNLVNEALVREFDLKDPVGQKTPGSTDVIVGVVKDFTISSFKQEIPPVIISYYENGRALLIDYAGNDLSGLIPQLEQAWRSVFPDNYFDYTVVQEALLRKHKDDIFLFRIVISFSLISIVLSCFGLFALSWAVVQNRTKEIGIRKILGATAVDILNLLTFSFTKRIALALFIAAPLGYYLMDQWLAGFVNRIHLDVWVFVVSASAMIFISALTLSLHTLKATRTNPVDEIRNE